MTGLEETLAALRAGDRATADGWLSHLAVERLDGGPLHPEARAIRDLVRVGRIDAAKRRLELAVAAVRGELVVKPEPAPPKARPSTGAPSTYSPTQHDQRGQANVRAAQRIAGPPPPRPGTSLELVAMPDAARDAANVRTAMRGR